MNANVVLIILFTIFALLLTGATTIVNWVAKTITGTVRAITSRR